MRSDTSTPEGSDESLSFLSDDPLTNFSIPMALRKHSAELDKFTTELEGRIETLSALFAEPLNDDLQIARRYIEQRTELVEDAAKALRRGRTVLADLIESGQIDKGMLKGWRDVLKASDLALLSDRALLASDGTKLRYRMLANPVYVGAGEAYLASLARVMRLPEGAMFEPAKRDRLDQASFRLRLRAAYNPPGCDDDPINKNDWCPITKSLWVKRGMKAAHIAPWEIGERNAAYLFGLSVMDGYTAIWDTQNGLRIYCELEERLGRGRIVVIPDGANEFKAVVLDETILKRELRFRGSGLFYRDFHNKRLEFKTEARPARKYLYFLCLLSLFRRKRYNVVGWQKDCEKILNPAIWGTPQKWLRRSILQHLAMEMGDVERLEDVAGEENGFTDFPGQVSEEEERLMAVQIRHNIEGLMYDDDRYSF